MSERDLLVADLVDEAGRRDAYGALIAEAHRQWAARLKAQGIGDGVPRDVQLLATIERLEKERDNANRESQRLMSHLDNEPAKAELRATIERLERELDQTQELVRRQAKELMALAAEAGYDPDREVTGE